MERNSFSLFTESNARVELLCLSFPIQARNGLPLLLGPVRLGLLFCLRAHQGKVNSNQSAFEFWSAECPKGVCSNISNSGAMAPSDSKVFPKSNLMILLSCNTPQEEI